MRQHKALQGAASDVLLIDNINDLPGDPGPIEQTTQLTTGVICSSFGMSDVYFGLI